MYADLLRDQFPDLNPEVDDLFLLETHQIADLPERAPARRWQRSCTPIRARPVL